jgi:hypothetical protein
MIDEPTPVKEAAETRIGVLQAALSQLPQLDCPVTHRFTPGLYAREIFMPKGSLLVSRIHKTEHPYVVISGRVLVFTEENGVVELRGGYVGITKPGAQRALLLLEDTRWITFHPTHETDLQILQDTLTTTPDVSHLEGAHTVDALNQLRAEALRLTEGIES